MGTFDVFKTSTKKATSFSAVYFKPPAFTQAEIDALVLAGGIPEGAILHNTTLGVNQEFGSNGKFVSLYKGFTNEAKTASFTAEYNVNYIVSNGLTMTLPAITGENDSIKIKVIDASIITVDTTGGATIDGNTSIAIDEPYTELEFYTYNNNWLIR